MNIAENGDNYFRRRGKEQYIYYSELKFAGAFSHKDRIPASKILRTQYEVTQPLLQSRAHLAIVESLSHAHFTFDFWCPRLYNLPIINCYKTNVHVCISFLLNSVDCFIGFHLFLFNQKWKITVPALYQYNVPLNTTLDPNRCRKYWVALEWYILYGSVIHYCSFDVKKHNCVVYHINILISLW